MFDRIAPRYDRMNRLLTLGLDQQWRRLALRTAEVGPGDRVVDVACGTGDLAELAAARGARVLGVDFAGRMLRAAKQRRVPADFALADAAKLPLPDGAATVVTCGFAMRNFSDLRAVLAEMARILVPGGRIALLEVDRPANVWLRRAHGIYFDGVVPRVGGWLSDRRAYAYLPQSTVYLPPAPELAGWIEAAGFEALAKRRLGLGAAQLLVARRRNVR
jgi:demethylmenaquinone methyltransferase/2-methoxy-6-polyprenyl-1,4-benzoquinol methylase